MQQIVLIHPIGQACAFICGMYNIITAYTRRFHYTALHVNIGLLYYFLACLGAGMGALISTWLERSHHLETGLHAWTAGCMILFFIPGAITGFMMIYRLEKKDKLRHFHKYINSAGVFLFCIQITSGMKLLVVLYGMMENGSGF